MRMRTPTSSLTSRYRGYWRCVCTSSLLGRLVAMEGGCAHRHHQYPLCTEDNDDVRTCILNILHIWKLMKMRTHIFITWMIWSYGRRLCTTDTDTSNRNPPILFIIIRIYPYVRARFCSILSISDFLHLGFIRSIPSAPKFRRHIGAIACRAATRSQSAEKS